MNPCNIYCRYKSNYTKVSRNIIDLHELLIGLLMNYYWTIFSLITLQHVLNV